MQHIRILCATDAPKLQATSSFILVLSFYAANIMVPGLQLDVEAPMVCVDSLKVASKSPPILSKSSRKRKRSRRVGFATTKTIKLVARMDAPTWYTFQDYVMFENDVRSTIRALRGETTATESTEVCGRGLEKYATSQNHEEKKWRERMHYSAILQEQERQKSKGVRNTRVLRTISKQNSKWAREKAMAQAQCDAREVVGESLTHAYE
jgi:hypothetical protein